MFPLTAQFGGPAPSRRSYAEYFCVCSIEDSVGRIERGVERGGGGTICSAYSEARSIFNESSDLDKVEENGRVNRPWARRVIIAVGQAFEDLWGKIQPLAVVGRNMPPVPGSRVSRLWPLPSGSRFAIEYLLRHMIKVGGTGHGVDCSLLFTAFCDAGAGDETGVGVSGLPEAVALGS